MHSASLCQIQCQGVHGASRQGGPDATVTSGMPLQKALREIRAYQKTVQRLVPRMPVVRLIREIIQKLGQCGKGRACNAC